MTNRTFQANSSEDSRKETGHSEAALDLFFQGYNCAQAVVGAFSDVIGLPQKVAIQMVAGFGAGMGDHRGTCGTISGMVFVASSVLGGYSPQDLKAKRDLYALVNQLKAAFAAEYESILCGELLKKAAVLPKAEADERTAQYYAKRPCARFVASAAKILDDWLATLPSKHG